MTLPPKEPLFEPSAEFAAEWFVDDPLAQGALKHGSVTILDVLDDAREEIGRPSPDFGDASPLGVFPSAVRVALTPGLVEQVRCAAVIMGWKLAQPGPAMAPGCVAEELALEMIRREALDALELVNAPPTSLSATRGVFEVCEDDDVLDLFEMEEPADASLAMSDPLNVQLGKADMRVDAWFESFYGAEQGFQGHPIYFESFSEAKPWGSGSWPSKLPRSGTGIGESVSRANLKHVFIAGRRVTFDRRDDSVVLFPDKGFRFNAAEPIGTATGFGRDWTATAPDGTTRRRPGRKAAAEWLIERTRDERDLRRLETAARRKHESDATEAAIEIIRSVRPDYRSPRPSGDDLDGDTFFVFEPSELLELLQDLVDATEAKARK